MQISFIAYMCGAIYIVALALVITPDLDATDANWRMLVLCAAIPNVISFVFCWFLPESPYFVANIGRKQETKEIFNEIFKKNDQALLTEEENELIDNFTPVETHSFLKLFNSKYLKTTLILEYM